MNKKTRLLALNGLLLAVLAFVALAPPVEAQSRPRGEYTMVAGRANGAPSGVVYIVNSSTQELIAITWDPNQKQIQGIGYRSLVRDGNALMQGANAR